MHSQPPLKRFRHSLPIQFSQNDISLPSSSSSLVSPVSVIAPSLNLPLTSTTPLLTLPSLSLNSKCNPHSSSPPVHSVQPTSTERSDCTFPISSVSLSSMQSNTNINANAIRTLCTDVNVSCADPPACPQLDLSQTALYSSAVNLSKRDGVASSNVFVCGHCSKSFQSDFALKQHKRIHGRPFACMVSGCIASFSKANHLSRHIRIVHNKERPFACTEIGCGARFGSKSHLSDHTRAVHMRLRNFKCTMCDASWSKRFNLEKHIRIRHYGEKPFRCSFCYMHFGTRSHVTRHELKVHKRTADLSS